MHTIRQNNSCSASQNTDRIFYFDVLRAMACLFVVVIHVSTKYVDQHIPGHFIVGNFFDSLARAGVPLFVMISGALMLDKDYCFQKQKWLCHIGKMAAFFVFWSAAYSFAFYVFRPWKDGAAIDTIAILQNLFQGYYHLWFVPMIIGLYCIVPLLRLWITEKNIKYVEYYLILAVIFSFALPQFLTLVVHFIPVFSSLQNLLTDANLSYLKGYSFYFILGWYLTHKQIPEKKCLWILLALAGFLITFFGSHMLNLYSIPSNFYSNFSLNVLVYSTALFLLCKFLFKQPPLSKLPFHNIIMLICKHSLGIYAMHIVLMEFIFNELLLNFPAIAAIPVVSIACAAVSILLSCIMKKIPILRCFV